MSPQLVERSEHKLVGRMIPRGLICEANQRGMEQDRNPTAARDEE